MGSVPATGRRWEFWLYAGPISKGSVRTVKVKAGDGHQRTSWLTVTVKGKRLLSTSVAE
jgi:hypothetical protein